MKKTFQTLLIGIVAVANGQQPHAESEWKEFRAAALRADVAFLTSDGLEGRRAMHRGADIAAEYVAAEFRKAGLQPLQGESYFQEVPLIEYRLDMDRTQAVMTNRGNTQNFAYFTDFSCDGPIEADIDAPLLYAGYGISAPEHNYDDYAVVDARGKIVVIFQHEPQEARRDSAFNGLGLTPYANQRVKVLNAQRHGAVGVLLVPEPNRKHPSSAERRALAAGGVDKRPQRAGATIGLGDGEVHIPSCVLRDSMFRALLAPSALVGTELQEAIDATLRPNSFDIPDTRLRLQVALAEMRRGVSSSVLGLLEGSDPELKKDTILISGHLDHVGISEGKMRPGADDNASGTAGVMALARAFSAAPRKPKRSILFAVWTAEEYPDLGSFFYTSHPLRPLAGTRAVLNMDMIGRNETAFAYTDGYMGIDADTSNQVNLFGVMNCPACRKVFVEQNKTTGLDISYKWESDYTLNLFERSDHFPFAMHGIPALWIFTGFHPDYHQPTDTIEKINFSKMEKIVKLVYLSAWQFADTVEPPRFEAKGMPGGIQ